MFKEVVEFLQKNRSPDIKLVTVPTEGAVQVLLVPEGMRAEGVKPYLDKYLKKPERRQGRVAADDLESLVNLTNRFKNKESALFCRATINETSFSASLESVLNYSPANGDNEDADNHDHSVVYQFPVSVELQTWLKSNGVVFEGGSFAEFLEDNSADMVIPSLDKFKTRFFEGLNPAFATPSKIIELARGIEVRVDEKVTQVRRVEDGSFNIQYSQTNTDSAGQPLKLPEWFCLGIQVFEGGDFYQIPVRLRFRVQQGKVSWFYQLYRKNDIFRAAFDADCISAATQTELPIYCGQK